MLDMMDLFLLVEMICCAHILLRYGMQSMLIPNYRHQETAHTLSTEPHNQTRMPYWRLQPIHVSAARLCLWGNCRTRRSPRFSVRVAGIWPWASLVLVQTCNVNRVVDLRLWSGLAPQKRQVYKATQFQLKSEGSSSDLSEYVAYMRVSHANGQPSAGI